MVQEQLFLWYKNSCSCDVRTTVVSQQSLIVTIPLVLFVIPPLVLFVTPPQVQLLVPVLFRCLAHSCF